MPCVLYLMVPTVKSRIKKANQKPRWMMQYQMQQTLPVQMEEMPTQMQEKRLMEVPKDVRLPFHERNQNIIPVYIY